MVSDGADAYGAVFDSVKNGKRIPSDWEEAAAFRSCHPDAGEFGYEANFNSKVARKSSATDALNCCAQNDAASANSAAASGVRQ